MAEFLVHRPAGPGPAVYRHHRGAAPRNGFGFSLASLCAAGTYCGPNCPYPSPQGFTVDAMFVSVDYAMQSVNFSKDGCVQESNGPTSLNHIEVRLSRSAVIVYATTPAAAPWSG